MDYETRSPLLTDSNLEQINYDNYANKNPNCNTKIYYKHFHHPCYCKCHYYFPCHYLHHNFFISRNSNINQTELDLKQKYNLYPQRNRNRSLNNILYSQNDNSLEELKRKYYNYYNDNKNNNKNKNKNKNKNNNNEIYNYRYKNDLHPDNNIKKIEKNYSSPNLIIQNNKNTDNINNYNNYTFKDIKIKNNDLINNNNSNNKNNTNNHLQKNITNVKNNVIRPSKSFQIKRKELSKYYHTTNLRKYSYGGDILETVSNADNHKYKEVISTSNSKDKNINKNRVIYNSQNNIIDTNTNNNNNKNYNLKVKVNNNYLNDRLNNHKYINFRYKSYQNSPTKISRNFLYEPKESNTEIKKKIVKETYNTRLVESKELKKSPTEKYLYNFNNDDIKYRNKDNNIYNLNQISNGIKYDNNNIFLYQNDNKYNNNNINNINNRSNSKFENNGDICIEYDYNKINNNKNSNNLNNMPKSYSFNNVDNLKKYNSYNLKNIKNNYQTEYENNFSNNDNYNIQNKPSNNNTDYEMIKLKVKLALLRKQIYEQERERIFNNEKNEINKDLQNKKYLEKFLSKGNIKPYAIDNNTLFEKTKKLLEANKLRNIKKELNNRNKQNNENRILYSLKKNLREKNDIDKNDMIKPRLKMWKP